MLWEIVVYRWEALPGSSSAWSMGFTRTDRWNSQTWEKIEQHFISQIISDAL